MGVGLSKKVQKMIEVMLNAGTGSSKSIVNILKNSLARSGFRTEG
jgi:hypothetical protein